MSACQNLERFFFAFSKLDKRVEKAISNVQGVICHCTDIQLTCWFPLTSYLPILQYKRAAGPVSNLIVHRVLCAPVVIKVFCCFFLYDVFRTGTANSYQ